MNQLEKTPAPSIPGYDYGTAKSAVSPISEHDLAQIEQSAGWTAADADVLARHAQVFQASVNFLGIVVGFFAKAVEDRRGEHAGSDGVNMKVAAHVDILGE